MLCVGLGQTTEYTNINGEEHRRISSVALHVQTMWRMVDKENSKILFAETDVYAPRNTDKLSDGFSPENFNWELKDANLFDEKSKKWLEQNKGVYVKKCKMNKMGDMVLYLSNNNALEIFVDITDDTECWRVFKVGEEEKHLVMTGNGWLR